MTPSHPPRPPLSALPKHSSMETSSGANKHPLEPPTAQAPPSKHVRCKAYPFPSQAPDQVYVAASAAVEMPQPSRPCPKGPPAEYMPTPPEIASMQTDVHEDNRKARMDDKGRYIRVKSNRDIDWSKPLWEQLVPVLRGGPSPDKSQDELRACRAKVPEMTNVLLNGIFPADNIITAVQKNHGVRKIHMSEPAAWVLNGTHWFSLLQQLFLVTKSLMYDDSKIYGPCLQWQEPTTIWDGTPVLGSMAETFLDDLSSIGFKDFNPMWTFPTTSVNQCWDALTFGMPPWHIGKDDDLNQSKAKDALQSQSPIAAFKSTNMLQALGIAYSKIVLPSGDSKGAEKKTDLLPHYMVTLLYMGVCSHLCRSIETGRCKSIVVQGDDTSSSYSLSNKSQSHPACAFADCASTVMCGAMISLTPCIAPKTSRDCDLDASMSFTDVNEMIQHFNAILAGPKDFPQIPTPRSDCHIYYPRPAERHKQMVICPEQDCEWVAYMHDLDTSMVEALGVHEDHLWRGRVQDYKEWQQLKGSKSSNKAWTWEGSSSMKWSTTSTKGSSKRGQSVPVDISKRTNPEEQGLDWRCSMRSTPATTTCSRLPTFHAQ